MQTTKFDPKALGFKPTMSEIAIAREVWKNSPNVTTKVLLGQFSRECPNCGAGYDDWKLIPPIRPSGKYSFVKYQCAKCQCVFKKIESEED